MRGTDSGELKTYGEHYMDGAPMIFFTALDAHLWESKRSVLQQQITDDVKSANNDDEPLHHKAKGRHVLIT